MIKLNTKNARNKLAIRNEPYWISLSTGRAIGFRKTGDGGSWQAKYINSTGKRFKQALGAKLTYEEALAKCNEWFKEMDSSTTSGRPNTFTVADAAKKYIAYLEEHKSRSTYIKTKYSIDKHIIPALGDIELDKLTALKMMDWSSGLLIKNQGADKLRSSKDTANRTMTSLKAMLNMAFKLSMVSSNVEWLKVAKYKNVAQARTVFLNKEQLSSLVDNCDGDLKLLVQAGIYTGARLGELTGTKPSDFSASKGCLTVTGKTGSREVYLSPVAVQFFTDLCTGNPGYLLPHNGKQWLPGYSAAPLKRAVNAANLPPETCFYTLRHSYISLALLKGINIHLLAKQCGNSAMIIEKNYGKFISSDIKAAFSTEL